MKIKKLSANSRGVLAMACNTNNARSRIYLVAENQNGLGWYETQGTYAKSTASKYVGAGMYKVVFNLGIQKSKKIDWL